MTVANVETSREVRSWLTALLLVLVVVVAYWTRYRFVLLFGGTEADYITWAKTNYYGGITPSYLKTANALRTGDYSQWSPLYPAGYSIVLALLSFVSGLDVFQDTQGLRFLQIGLDALGPLLVYSICRNLQCSEGASIFGAFQYALFPWWAWGSTVVLADSLVPLFVLVTLALLLHARKSGKMRDWAFVGLSASWLAIVRSEFGVLFLAMGIFAWIASPKAVRYRAVGFVMLGFWGLWFAVATFNYLKFGHFFTATNIVYYALFSGLGQVDNPYGYYVSDLRAESDLRAVGIKFHTPEAETYFRKIYFDAWMQHPAHVLSTIWRRVQIILFEIDYILGTHLSWAQVFTEKFGLAVLGAAVALLAWHRRYVDILVILGPLVVALGSLGLMYVEARYVRYVPISYTLASAVVVSFAGQAVARRLTIGTATQPVFLALSLGLLVFLLRPLDLNVRSVLNQSEARDLLSSAPSVPARFVPDATGAKVLQKEDGRAEIVTSDVQLGYQGRALFENSCANYVTVEYDVTSSGGPGQIGILRGDGRAFLALAPLQADTPTKGQLTAPLYGGTTYAILIATAKGTRFEVSNVTARMARLKEKSQGVVKDLLWLLLPTTLNRPPLAVEICDETSRSG